MLLPTATICRMIATKHSKSSQINVPAAYATACTAHAGRKENHVCDSLEVVRRRPQSIALRQLRLGNRAKRLSQGEVEAFCRLVGPNGLVPFAERDCTGYADRRLPGAPANAKSTDRRFGFVTTLTLREEEPESINDSEGGR